MTLPKTAVVSEVNKHSNPSKSDWRVVVMMDRRDDGQELFKEYVVFKGELADALKIGEPLPPDTEEEEPKFNGALPSLKLPWKGGGGKGQAAWKNTKEGFEAEQKMWANKQRVEEERKDRRTAVMTAQEMFSGGPASWHDLKTQADFIYDWLRETSGTER
jgi:hypothetical protein